MGRLLPWTGSDGQPAFLAPGSENGALARLADSLEESQLQDASVVFDHALSVLENENASDVELRFVAERLSECLFNAMRVADSRGARLPDAEGDA